MTKNYVSLLSSIEDSWNSFHLCVLSYIFPKIIIDFRSRARVLVVKPSIQAVNPYALFSYFTFCHFYSFQKKKKEKKTGKVSL